jgi:hypothetical protein
MRAAGPRWRTGVRREGRRSRRTLAGRTPRYRSFDHCNPLLEVDRLPGDGVDDHLQIRIIDHVGHGRGVCVARELLCKHAIGSDCRARRNAREANTKTSQELPSSAAKKFLFAHGFPSLAGRDQKKQGSRRERPRDPEAEAATPMVG